jgi:membrane protease subunit HflK
MTLLVEKLLDFLREFIVYFLPFQILGDDQCGLIRRFGKYRRSLKPGWNWKWPVFETAMTEIAALGSMTLREQTLTTRDGKQITLRGVLTWKVSDPKKYILGCDNAQSVVNDVGCCVIAELVPSCDSAEVLSGEGFSDRLERRMRARARRWGITVDSFGLVDRVQTQAYRLITSAPIDLPTGV